MRRVTLIPISLIILLCLSGCWDRKEINEVTLVTGLALEAGEGDTFSLTIEGINASELDPSMSEGLTPSITYELKGLTMAELLTKMNMGITRELNFSHARTLIVDEQVAKQGLSKFLQFLEKSGQFRNDFQIIVARGVSASDVITTTYPIQKVPSLKIYEQITTIEENWGGYPQTALPDFIFSLTAVGKEPVAAAVTVTGNPDKGSNIENNKELDLRALIEFDGMALFEDDQLKGFLSVEETRNYMWIQDIDQTTTSARCGEDGFFAMEIFNSHTKIDTEFVDLVPKINVQIVVEGDIHDNQCPDSLDDIKTYEKYQKLMKEHLETKLETTIAVVQEDYGIDIFGFGEQLRKQHYQQFKKHIKDWNEEFKRADISVKASVYLRRDGMRTKSFIEQLD
ncbi:Ger(x)C family spore germination protein [Halalkalibacter krulwichiae]|uniref:Spore germination protein B3 n=1 Tax=Halalkalibacter krulwichiae TaxID=199441 RepID=A0A1X9MB78_9BACI|nr:Ger(x)C family spore germination protein [Halalkalibacter krulwichiae]ARK30699.1 Spore germination protein B3 precursor [Halalkalibacter krulwichiae]